MKLWICQNFVCVCAMFNKTLEFKNDLFGFCNTGIVTADAIFDLLKRVFDSLKLDLNLMVQ
jgi:hypothetical protein